MQSRSAGRAMAAVASGQSLLGATDAGMPTAAGAPAGGAPIAWIHPIARPCAVCGKESAVWGPGVQRCADHFDFDRHQAPSPPDPKPREEVSNCSLRRAQPEGYAHERGTRLRLVRPTNATFPEAVIHRDARSCM